jgi:WD40 repeat protein
LGLEPPLRSDIENLKFSPSGEYSLAQDDASIFVFANDPFTFLFRIDAPEARHAQFSPDSQKILFVTEGLRVEEWSIDDQERTSVHEMTVPEGCLQSTLSHDGKLLGCVNRNLDLSLIEVESGNTILTKKAYFEPKGFGPGGDVMRLLIYIILADFGDGRWIRMTFSPDDHYFAATAADSGIGVDVPSHTQIPLRRALNDLLNGEFAFLAPDRVIVQNHFDPKNSGIIEFPSRKVLQRLPISQHQNLDAPTRGNYVILRPVKDAQVGVLDLKSLNFVIGSSKSSVIYVYDQKVLSQRVSGEVGIFEMSTHERKGQAELPNSTLGTPRAWAVSPDLRWLAVSGASRGAVWDLANSKRLYYTRGFRGAYFDGDQAFYADFPKLEAQPRTVARADLSRENIVSGPAIEQEEAAQQYAQFILLRKPVGKDAALNHNITLEVEDVKDGHVLWSRNFPKEAPVISFRQQRDSLVFEWGADESATKDEIKGSASLQTRFAAMRERKGAYLVEVVDADSGDVRGRLLLDTGRGSFRVTRAFAEDDWVLIGDNENRTRVYSLSTGEQKGILFGTHSALSSAAGILIVENQSGQIEVYNLNTLQKRTHLTFPHPISAWSFSADGKRLLVLTANQTVYVFDTKALDKVGPAIATAP